MCKKNIRTWLGCVTLVLLAAGCSGEKRECTPEDKTVTSERQAAELSVLIQGSVVYERMGKGIFKTVIGNSGSVCIAESGSWPRWSPDGGYIAFVRDNRIMRVTADGKSYEVVVIAEEPRAVAYHPNGKEIIFTDGLRVKSVNLKTREVRVLAKGYIFREIDISADGQRLVCTVSGPTRILAFDLMSGKERQIARGCSASISPDGGLVTNNEGNHDKLALRKWDSGKTISTISAPPGNKFDNQFWSNHQDWLASKTEGRNNENIFVHQMPADRAFQVTYTGDCDRPDLYVRDK